MTRAVTLPEDPAWVAVTARQAAAYMAGDGHARCVARVQEGTLTIADHLMRLQRVGALFSPKIIPAKTNAH